MIVEEASCRMIDVLDDFHGHIAKAYLRLTLQELPFDNQSSRQHEVE
jgi:hypothetical protein